jgi:hypothetical protein
MGDAKPHTSFLTHRSLQGIPTNHPDKVLTFDRGQHITRHRTGLVLEAILPIRIGEFCLESLVGSGRKHRGSSFTPKLKRNEARLLG